MKGLRTWWAVALFGMVVGVMGTLVVQSWTSAQERARQDAEFATLRHQIQEQQDELDQRQLVLDEQAEALKSKLERASDLADQVTQIQGTSVERLKKVIEVLKGLKAELQVR